MKDLRSVGLIAAVNLIWAFAMRNAVQKANEKHLREVTEGLKNFYKNLRREYDLNWIASEEAIR